MAFELHHNNTPSRATTPYLLNIQNELCRTLSTRLIVPVVTERPVRSHTDFVVELRLGATPVYALISHMAAVPIVALGAVVSDCSDRYEAIRDLVDRLIVGF